jgi:hypothetical protein
MSDVPNKVAVVIEFILYDVQKFAEIFPLHVFAFSMEVEPGVTQLFVAHLLVETCKAVTDALLGALFVNQVHKVLRTISA